MLQDVIEQDLPLRIWFSDADQVLINSDYVDTVRDALIKYNYINTSDVTLPGSANDYIITTKFKDATFVGNDGSVVTVIPKNSADGGESHWIKLSSSVRLDFAEAFTNNVTMDLGVYVEMARLAQNDSYGWELPFKGDSYEPLAFEEADSGATRNAAVVRRAVENGWRTVSSAELDLAPAGGGNFGPEPSLPGVSTLMYSFVNGSYQAVDPENPFLLFGPSEANALVLTGIVGSKRTLQVTFRGTDQAADFGDYANFFDHYKKFAPLTSALKLYVQSEGIEQILVAGHSLGGAMAQIFAREFGTVLDADAIQVFTFGSPGAEPSLPSSANQINFFRSGDPVAALAPDLSDPASPLGEAARDAVKFLFGGLGDVAVAAIDAAMIAKDRAGIDIVLRSDLPISLGQHGNYDSELERLILFAHDAAGPFNQMQLAQALLSGSGYAGPSVQLALSGQNRGRISTGSGDDLVLGDSGTANRIGLTGIEHRVIDGGDGLDDNLALPFQKSNCTIQTIGDRTEIYTGTLHVATVYRVETLTFAPPPGMGPPSDPSVLVLHLDGSPTTRQTAAPGATTLVVDASADVAYAGVGVRSITGKSDDAIIVYGRDVETIATTGSVTIMADSGGTAGQRVIIDPGQSVATVHGGVADEKFIGHLSGAQFNGSSGNDTLVIANTGRREITHGVTTEGAIAIVRGDAGDSYSGIETLELVDGKIHHDASSAAAQVVRLYQAGLGREADQGGLNYWIASIEAGAPLANLANGFIGSAEFAARYGSATTTDDYVELLYDNALGRPSDALGKATWINMIDGGSIGRADALIGFSESAENRAQTADVVHAGIWDVSENAAFLARLYDTALGRLPDVMGVKVWRGLLESGAQTRQDVVNGFMTSQEFIGRYGANLATPEFVGLLYLNTLHRGPDPIGEVTWVGLIDSGTMSRADAVLGFSESAEHYGLTAEKIMSDNPTQFGILFAS